MESLQAEADFSNQQLTKIKGEHLLSIDETFHMEWN